ncbi:MAG: potassium/proton antiporter [Actinomycetes bacterium]
MSAEFINLAVLVAAGVLIAGVVVVRLSYHSSLPSLLWYLFIGLAIGEAGLGIRFDDVDLTRTVGTLLLALILVDGGLTTRWDTIRPIVSRSAVLATLGVLITVAVTSAIAYALLGVDLRTAVLLGSVAASTDAAATFSVLRKLPVKPTTRATLEAESGFNDPPVIVIVTVVTSDAWLAPSPLAMAAIGSYQLLVGAAVGLALGWVGAKLLGRSALPVSGLYPLGILSVAMLSFSLGGLLGASGLMACYAAGLVLGNAAIPHLRTSRGFTDSASWLAQIGLFVMLGLLSSPARLPAAIPTALVIGVGLTFVARPLAVALCLTPFRVPWREQAFVAWAGLRGAVPIVLATIPLTMMLPSAPLIFDTVFLLVVVMTLVQGPLLPAVARWTGMIVPDADRELDVESAPLEEAGVSLLKFEVRESSRLAGLDVGDLMLPSAVSVVMVLRDGQVIVPTRTTRLRTRDGLVVAAPDDAIASTQARLRAISRGGRLARWHDLLHRSPTEPPPDA